MGLYDIVRGYGTHLGLECPSERAANSLQGWFLAGGIHILKCGPKTLALRPSMTFNVHEGAVFRDHLSYYHPNWNN